MRKLITLAVAVAALALSGVAAAGIMCEEYGEEQELVTLCVPVFDEESEEPIGSTTIEVPGFIAFIYFIVYGDLVSEGACQAGPAGTNEVIEPVIPAREILCLDGRALDLEVGTPVEGATVARFYVGVGATCDDLGGSFTGTYVGATGDVVAPEHADLSFVVAYPLYA